MRCDDGYNTTRSKNEALTLRLVQGIGCLLPDLIRISVDQRILSHAAAHDTVKQLLSFRE